MYNVIIWITDYMISANKDMIEEELRLERVIRRREHLQHAEIEKWKEFLAPVEILKRGRGLEPDIWTIDPDKITVNGFIIGKHSCNEVCNDKHTHQDDKVGCIDIKEREKRIKRADYFISESYSKGCSVPLLWEV